MKNRGSTPILTNAVGVHPRNIHTKFEANPCSGLRGEVEKLKSSRRQQRQRRQRQRRRRRRTQPDRYSHTHSLSVTKNRVKVRFFIGLSQHTQTDFQSQTKNWTYLTIRYRSVIFYRRQMVERKGPIFYQTNSTHEQNFHSDILSTIKNQAVCAGH